LNTTAIAETAIAAEQQAEASAASEPQTSEQPTASAEEQKPE
jgi:hypothetical protein